MTGEDDMPEEHPVEKERSEDFRDRSRGEGRVQAMVLACADTNRAGDCCFDA